MAPPSTSVASGRFDGADAVELCRELACHEVRDGLARGFVLVEDAVTLLDDRQLEPEPLRQIVGALRRLHAFRNVAEAGEDVGELAALSELEADGAVAREISRAREYEIT